MASIIGLFLLALSKALLQDQTMKDETSKTGKTIATKDSYPLPKTLATPILIATQENIDCNIFLYYTHTTTEVCERENKVRVL